MRTVLLAELFTVSGHDERSMEIDGSGKFQCLLQQDLPRCVVSQILPANHVGHSLGCVIHHHRKLIGPKAIRTSENKVAYYRLNVLLLSAQLPIVPSNKTVIAQVSSGATGVQAPRSGRSEIMWL